MNKSKESEIRVPIYVTEDLEIKRVERLTKKTSQPGLKDMRF